LNRRAYTLKKQKVIVKRMDQISETLEQVTQTSESGKEISQENYKYVKIVGIPNVINSITSTSPVDKSLLYRLSKIHELKWKVKKVDPEWHPVDQIALMEYQILNLIDEIDCTEPWHDAENKLKNYHQYKKITAKMGNIITRN